MENPLKKIKAQWVNKIRAGKDAKKEFDEDATQCMRFFTGPYDFMYGLGSGERKSSGDFVMKGGNKLPQLSAAMTVNKVAEGVQLFAPFLYHRNPVRKVNPREVPIIGIGAMGNVQDPQVQAMYAQMVQQVQQGREVDKARGDLLEWYLNYTPAALDLKSEARNMIDEALIKGMGLLYSGLYTPAGSKMRLVGSFHDTVDNALIDPDMENRRDAKWRSQRCVKAVWEFEAEYGLPPGSVKGTKESRAQQTSVNAEGGEGELHRKRGETNNLVVYHKVWSKMGMGPLMAGCEWDNDSKEMDRFGQYVYLVICESLDYPANLPPSVWDNEEAMQKAVQWETPFWADDAWPCSELVFHEVPRQIWPASHFKFGMGELIFLNWAYSFLASKIVKISRDIIIVAKGADEELKRVILSGADMEVAYLAKSQGTIKEVVDFLQHPEIHGDMYKVLELIERNFEKRTGLSELMYGDTAHAYRSAEEANIKGAQMKIRPDDMVNKVEDTMTDSARKEGLAARWHLEPEQDILPLMGTVGAQWWGTYVTPADPSQLLHSLEYRTEANSMRKPNKEKEVADATTAVQQLFAPYFQVAQAGNVEPYNALMSIWAKANEWPVDKLLLPPPPPQQPQPDLPKIAVSLDFTTLNPFVQQKILELGGIIPPGTQIPGPLAASPEQNSVMQGQQEMMQNEQSHEQMMRHESEKHTLAQKHAKEKAAIQAKNARKGAA